MEVFVVEFYICWMSCDCNICVSFDQDFTKALDFGVNRKIFIFFATCWQQTQGVNEH